MAIDGGALDRWRLARRARRVDWRRVGSTRPGVQVLDLPTTRLRIRVQPGQAPLGLVFLCDPPNSAEHFDEVFENVGSRASVACIEQPGFGFSFPKRGYDFGLPAHAEVLAAALEALRFETTVLVAPCVSSYSAIRVARERPELVDRLVLMQATDLDEERRWVLRTAEKFTRRVTGIPKLGSAMVRVPFLAQAIAARTEPVFGERTYDSVIYPGAPRREELVARLVAEANDLFALGACNCMPNLVQTYLRCREQDFAGASRPTLVLWGDSDASHAASARDGLCRYVAKAEVQCIPETAHHLEIERPGEVVERILDFAQRR